MRKDQFFFFLAASFSVMGFDVLFKKLTPNSLSFRNFHSQI